MEKSFEPASRPGTIEYERVQHLIRTLHAIQTLEPEMNNVADIATFRIPIAAPAILEGKVPVTIKFYLEDGRWYLR